MFHFAFESLFLFTISNMFTRIGTAISNKSKFNPIKKITIKNIIITFSFIIFIYMSIFTKTILSAKSYTNLYLKLFYIVCFDIYILKLLNDSNIHNYSHYDYFCLLTKAQTYTVIFLTLTIIALSPATNTLSCFSSFYLVVLAQFYDAVFYINDIQNLNLFEKFRFLLRTTKSIFIAQIFSDFAIYVISSILIILI